MRKPSAGCLLATVLTLAPALHAQTPYIKSANNTASYDSTAIAQGSMFVIFGGFLGPATLVSATQLPLPNELGGTTVTVKAGATSLSCPMFYSSSGQVAAVLPSNTPVGTATIIVSFNSQNANTTINVVASSVGVFTPGATGLGIGIFTDALTGAHITPAAPAIPGEILTGWATGVGAAIGFDNTVATTFPNFPGVQVWIGGLPAQMSYAGRSGCCVAVDQLNFYVPAQVAQGCEIPVSVSSLGHTSATVTIPISTANTVPCTDSGPTLPSNLLTTALAGNPIKFGLLAVAPSSGPNTSAQPRYVADQLSAALHVPVSVEDADKIMRAAQSRNSKALKSAMSKYAAQWKALSPKAKARLAETVVPVQQTLSLGLFGSVANEGLATAALTAQMAPPGQCVVVPSPLPSQFGVISTGLDAGPSISLVGAAGPLTLQKKSLGDYQSSLNFNFAVGEIPLGSYTFSAPGGANIGAFSVTVNVSGHPTFTNTAALATIDRTQPLTVTWTGGVAGTFALIIGYADDNFTGLPVQIPVSKTGFVCTQGAATGTLTIPPYILQAMWPTQGGSRHRNRSGDLAGQHTGTRRGVVCGCEPRYGERHRL